MGGSFSVEMLLLPAIETPNDFRFISFLRMHLVSFFPFHGKRASDHRRFADPLFSSRADRPKYDRPHARCVLQARLSAVYSKIPSAFTPIGNLFSPSAADKRLLFSNYFRSLRYRQAASAAVAPSATAVV
ncbi:MAG: hypothetical protein Q4A88_09205, partial [Clostridia bacterium]|nr:hypothetical protein [Clostridia bacterium]